MLSCRSRALLRALAAVGLMVSAPPLVAPLAGQVQPQVAGVQGVVLLQGVVIDETTYQPLDSATVSLVGTNLIVRTDRWGSFAFPDAPLGSVSLQVSAPGRPSVVQDVVVQDDRIVFVQVSLPSVAAVLDELLVRSRQPTPDRDWHARTAIDLLALELPRIRTASGIVGQTDFALNLRAVGSFTGPTAPLIVIDGVAMTRPEGAYEALVRIPARDVAEIELLKGPAAAFLYPYAANGVVRVRTKQGR